MLGNCEKKMLIISSSSSSTTNEWPQQIDEKNLMPSTSKVMEKRVQQLSQQQQQQQIHLQPPPQQALKCPRCDSSNTKFCYYNNYSLSQPRHFCKACKRYWTRGGTLRNVPVGGGCRKNKRMKRPTSTTTTIEGGAGTSVSNPNNHPSHTQIDISSTSNHINPLFYGLPTNPSDMNLAFPGRFNSRNMDSVSGFDLQPQLNGLGLGFSNNSVFNPSKQIQDVVSNYSNIFGSSNSSASPTMATLLASSLNNNQQKLSMKDSRAGPNNNLYQSLTSFEDFQSNESGMKEVKIEQEHHNRSLEWNIPCQNQIDPIGFSTSDPSSLYWNTNSVGAWHDPGNIGSSVTSLI